MLTRVLELWHEILEQLSDHWSLGATCETCQIYQEGPADNAETIPRQYRDSGADH